jgi:MoxR-like ATPase
VLATRAPASAGLVDLADLIQYGASPRASLGLVAGARALALLRGRGYALPQDVFDVAPDVLRHRLVLSYEALARNLTSDHLLARILGTVPAPRIAPSMSPVAATVVTTPVTAPTPVSTVLPPS